MNMQVSGAGQPALAHEPSLPPRRTIRAGMGQILHPSRSSALTVLQRQVLGAFLAGHLGEPVTHALFDEWLSETSLRLAIRVADAAEQAARPDPYGALPGFAALLPSRVWRPDAVLSAEIGEDLAIGLEYVHLVLARSGEAAGHALLLEAYWSPEAVVEVDHLIETVQENASLHWARAARSAGEWRGEGK